MKFYVERPDKPDFIVNAASAGDAIVALWFCERETPLVEYRIHQGRRSEARTTSSAVGYWRLNIEMQSALIAVLKETATAEDYGDFCTTAVTIGKILGR